MANSIQPCEFSFRRRKRSVEGPLHREARDAFASVAFPDIHLPVVNQHKLSTVVRKYRRAHTGVAS